MIFKKYTRYFIAAMAILSCDHQKKGDEIGGVVTRISIDQIAPSAPLPYDAVIQTIHFIPLQTTSESLVTQITKLMITDDYIYIHDQRRGVLFLFSREGKFVKRLDPGDDPQSASEIGDFTLDDDGNICILGRRNLYQFDKDGNFLKKIIIDYGYDFIEYANPVFLAHLRGEYYLWTGSVGKRYLKERPDHALYKLDKNYRITNKYFITRRELMETWRFQEFKDSLYIMPNYLNDTVYKATPEAVKARYWVDFGDRAISQHPETQNFNKSESSIAHQLGQSTDLCMGIRNFFVMPGYIYSQYRCGMKGYHFFLNKKTGNHVGGRFDHEETPLFSPRAIHDNQIVFYSDAPRLIQEIETFKKNNQWPAYFTNAASQLDSLKSDDNPVLAFMMLKNF